MWYGVYMSNKHPKVVTISATVDDAAVAWSSLDHFYSATENAPADPLVVADGVLVSEDSDLLASVIDILTPPRVVTEVEVLIPGGMYVYTENRDTAADVAAAFMEAGNGRTLLDVNGWDALYASGQLGDDTDPDDEDEDEDADDSLVIY